MNSVAILIIGSLIWDQRDHRQAWRQKRLSVAAAIRVRSPIRYGRLSQGNTYTMVFSNGLVPAQLGWALAVPCRCGVHTLDHLVEEAEALWVAEQSNPSNPGPLAANWGAVGLLCNPKRRELDTLRAGWSARVASEHNIYKQFPHGDGEVPAVTPDGILTIPWPTTESGDSADVDFMLATATAPTLHKGAYATPQEIAAAWQRAPARRRYFDENRRAGIATAFDDDILECLRSTG